MKLNHQKKYSQKDIRNIRIGSVICVLIYIFIVLIPLFYTWHAEIPPLGSLNKTSGKFTYKKIGNKGNYLVGVSSSSSATFFTCAASKFGAYPDCLQGKSEYEKLVDQPTTAFWFEQPVYLFSTQKRLVKLIVSGEEKRSYEKTVTVTRRSKASAPWWIFILLILFTAIVVGFELKIWRQKNEQ